MAGTRFGVEIVGHTDNDGTEDQNYPLSRARADAARSLVGTGAFLSLDVTTRGVGPSAPLASGSSEDVKSQNRRVSFRVNARVATGVGAP